MRQRETIARRMAGRVGCGSFQSGRRFREEANCWGEWSTGVGLTEGRELLRAGARSGFTLRGGEGPDLSPSGRSSSGRFPVIGAAR